MTPASGTNSSLDAERTILLVDDEVAICRSLESLLTSRGYRVTVTTDGGEALRLIETHEYSRLLLDVNLPNVGGLYLARAARRRSAHARIVLITGALEYDSLERSVKDLQDVILLPKPFHLKDLLRILNGGSGDHP